MKDDILGSIYRVLSKITLGFVSFKVNGTNDCVFCMRHYFHLFIYHLIDVMNRYIVVKLFRMCGF